MVPKIPKMAVDDLLMLEAPKPPKEPKPVPKPTMNKLLTASSMDTQKPLPPIAMETDRTQTDDLRVDDSDLETERTDVKQEAADQDAFFLTQVGLLRDCSISCLLYLLCKVHFLCLKTLSSLLYILRLTTGVF